QVSPSSSTLRILSHTLYHEGIQGLYRGYKSTVLREDLWSWKQGHVVDSWQSAVCGAFAGGFAAAVTTPLDVAKTRIMLAKAGSSNASGNVLTALGGIWRTQGLSGVALCSITCDGRFCMNVCICVLYPFKLQAYASCGSEYHSFILRCVNHPS
uniref:Mitochondrial S-adenosylmethionine carrier protein n=1 Tax=Buteo japonicus TaxID=224669 RepID=A0A8C0ASW4_9AVES